MILYIAVLISIRIMGKAEIAQMNSFDLVITLLIAEVAAVPMENNTIPMVYGIASLSGLVFLQTLVSFLALKSRKVARFLMGSPAILIDNGVISYAQLRKERITLDELLEQLRCEGYFNLADVQYAILETDGNLSIVAKSTYKNPPEVEFKHLPISLILDGRILKEGLKLANKDFNWLYSNLKEHKIEDVRDVLICILDENDKLYIQPR
jgi:uncharacterized membrane protein YcaP (DUF421 family)